MFNKLSIAWISLLFCIVTKSESSFKRRNIYRFNAFFCKFYYDFASLKSKVIALLCSCTKWVYQSIMFRFYSSVISDTIFVFWYLSYTSIQSSPNGMTSQSGKVEGDGMFSSQKTADSACCTKSETSFRICSPMSRPAYGTDGRVIQLLSNHFNVKFTRHDAVFYNYSVSMQCFPYDELIISLLCLIHKCRSL